MSLTQPPQPTQFRALPSVNDVLLHCHSLIAREGRVRVVQAARRVLDAARDDIRAGHSPIDLSTAVTRVGTALGAGALPQAGQRVINATGVVIHTNLGRAPISEAAQRAMIGAAGSYSPLELDLESGERGRRGADVTALLKEVTGADASLVVNNCASATMLMLAALARGKGVVIARGQLVEIGGGFRVPEILEQSGAGLVEVGTTNRVRLEDYERAFAREGLAGALCVHPSNFKVVGFTQDVPLADLAAMCKRRDLLCLHDLGSGAIYDTAALGLAHEPTVQESVLAGAHVTCFSGDKLLGGPQAGILAGAKAQIEIIRNHPLARAMRADKVTLAGLAATLQHYARGEQFAQVPVPRMLAMSKAAIAQRAADIAQRLGDWAAARAVTVALQDGESAVGGGSLPGETLPTVLISLAPASAADFVAELRAANTPVIARVQQNKVLLDLRTVMDDDALVATLTQN